MNLPFLGNWRKRHGAQHGPALADARERDPEAVAQLLSECELLRDRAASSGVELDDTPLSLEALDQLQPRWRDDPEELSRLGNDAGLYLGTVVVRTVPGAAWQILPDGRPVVRLASGREIDVVAAGLEWAAVGAPELSQRYAEVSEG
ncbi:DUF6278 family protein [Streptomyces sp. NPDC018031]|uniref:DUF6278 family protein n=1 Tax=Streptomyces sp. NPDC018031 TaxID=3365033 RepID=UPI00378E4C57